MSVHGNNKSVQADYREKKKKKIKSKQQLQVQDGHGFQPAGHGVRLRRRIFPANPAPLLFGLRNPAGRNEIEHLAEDPEHLDGVDPVLPDGERRVGIHGRVRVRRRLGPLERAEVKLEQLPHHLLPPVHRPVVVSSFILKFSYSLLSM